MFERGVARLSVGRSDRPSRKLAGSIDDRILDAAGKVFADRGFGGASVDEIAEVARAGKPTIYARFPGKEALLTAVIERVLRRNTGSCDVVVIENRLNALAAAILTAVLAPETNGLIRVAVAEARRFPDPTFSSGAAAAATAGEAPPSEEVANEFRTFLDDVRTGLRRPSRCLSFLRRRLCPGFASP
jgi:AcrR family transcriptional regulator